MSLLAEAVSELRPNVEFLVKNGVLIWLDDPALQPSEAEITVKINEIQLKIAKENKISELKQAFDNEFKVITGDVLFHEMVSWESQEKEAFAYIADQVNSVTPFLDNLYAARNPVEATMDVDKLDLANKIVGYANYYKTFYPQLLGKYQNLISKVAAATTILDVQAIVW